jgi:unsaturated rhamnogalacturonyl hydrolase
MDNKSNVILRLCLPILMLISSVSFAQQRIVLDPNDKQAGRYDLPYEVPATDSIETVLAKIRDYLSAGTQLRIIDRTTNETITDFSKLNKNADLDNGDHGLFNIWAYTQGVTYAGMLKLAEVTGDKEYSDYALKCMNFYFDNLAYFKRIDSAYGQLNNSFRGLIHTANLDDCGSMGAALIRIYKIEKDPRMLAAIHHIADYVSSKQFRLADGTLARQRPQARSVWADDAYMSIPFLAEMGSLTGERKYYDDAVKQVLQMSKYLFRWEKGLYDHGVNIHNINDPNIYWGRANGWLIISIVDLLDVLPEKYQGRDKILKILRAHVQGLTEVQGKDGFWNNLIDKSDSYGETSCTALIVYGIAHSINKGWIDYTFGPVAQAGWNAIASKILPNGQVDGTCIATTFANENIYYYHRPVSVYASHGYGPVLLAGAEIINLFQNKKLIIRGANGTFHYRLKSEAGK